MNNIKTIRKYIIKLMPDFLLIDGSYYIFYRFFALQNWWKMANKDTPLDNPSENQEFIDKFKLTFQTKVKELSKNLKHN